MEAYEYQTMFDFETSYWWFQSMHRILLDQLSALSLPPGACLLDAGCGTGQNLSSIHQAGFTGYGFDISTHAAPFWKKRFLRRVCTASINDMPFPNAAFDAALCVDVFEIDAVDEDNACAELVRVTRPGGYILLIVPAYDWLMTEEHHRAIHASRRYSRQRVIDLLAQHRVEIVRTTNLFALLFPLLVVYRLGLRRSTPTADPRSDLKPLPRPINSLLKAVMGLERRLLSRVNLPFGSSILVIARKDAE